MPDIKAELPSEYGWMMPPGYEYMGSNISDSNNMVFMFNKEEDSVIHYVNVIAKPNDNYALSHYTDLKIRENQYYDGLGEKDVRKIVKRLSEGIMTEWGDLSKENTTQIIGFIKDGKIEDAKLAVWTTAFVNTFPDSSFGYISPGGKKDEEGKTVPRSLRHLPYKDKDGKVDPAHVRNALARLPLTDIPDKVKASVRSKLVAAAKSVGIKVSDEDNMSNMSFGGLLVAESWKSKLVD